MSSEVERDYGVGVIDTLKIANGMRSKPFETLDYLSDLPQQVHDLKLGPKRIVIIGDSDIAREILRQPDSIVRKSSRDIRVLRDLMGVNMFTSPGSEDWHERRAASHPAFNSEMMKNYRSTVLFKTEQYVESVKHLKDPVNLSSDISFLIASIGSELLFSHELEINDSELLLEVNQVLQSYAEIMKNGAYAKKFGLSRKHRARADSSKDKLDAFTQEVLREYNGDDNLLTMVVEGLDEERQYSEVLNYFVSSYETTSSVVSWALIELSNNSEWLNKVRTEAEGNNQNNSSEDLLIAEAIFKETLRLHPPIWLINRGLDESFDSEYLGEIDAGTLLSISPYLVHRNPNYWDNPKIFDPGRFLDFAQAKNEGFIPFGIGKRSCIGAPLANMEAPIIISNIAENFELLDIQAKSNFSAINKPDEPIMGLVIND